MSAHKGLNTGIIKFIEYKIENNILERIREFHFFVLTINQAIEWLSHVWKIKSK